MKEINYKSPVTGSTSHTGGGKKSPRHYIERRSYQTSSFKTTPIREEALNI